MKTKAVRLYGKKDLRLEEFELPPMKDDEILGKIVTDTLCMSSYKAVVQGPDHKRVPADAADRPIILGHEFCGEILEVGRKWRKTYSPGQRFSIQPALYYKGSMDTPGYSFPYLGGNAAYVVIPHQVMETECLLTHNAEAFFLGSLAEPVSCIVGTFRAMYHTDPRKYEHIMGIKDGGKMALLAGTGSMGLPTIDLALNGDRRPSFLVVTGRHDASLEKTARVFPPETARRRGVELHYLNTAKTRDPAGELLSISERSGRGRGGPGYDDVLVYAPVKELVEQADDILAEDGCLNFFAGPSNPGFKAPLNFYNVHYGRTHVVSTSGGNTSDMREALDLMAAGRLNPAAMITHIGGLSAAAEATLNLTDLPGGKKLIYTHLDLELTAIEDFAEKGKGDPLFADLAEIVARNGGLWCAEAEKRLLGKVG